MLTKDLQNGNFTMLDNLKLGYGGTKTEMQRLLDDASKISGIKYDISSFADITQAIHIMQEKMSIAGTTAKEANQTIQGSLSATKSAWQNLLTGLATGNADLGGLMNNLVEGVMITAQNIMPVVQNVVDNIVAMLPAVLNQIIANLPQFLEQGQNILNNLITGLTNNMPAVMIAVMQILRTLTETILQNSSQILQMGIQLIVSLVEGIAQQLPTLIPQMVDTVVLIVETLLDNIDMIVDAGIKLLVGLAEGLINALPDLIDKIPVIIDNLINTITNNLPKIIQAGIILIIKLGEGLIRAIPQLISKIPQIISSLVQGFANFFSNMGEVGKNLVSGIWEGIKNAKDWLLGKVKEWCGNILNGIKSFFGIHSPSKVFKDEIGTNLALGVGEGFLDTMKGVSEKMSASIPTEFDINSTFNKVDKSSQLNLESITKAFVTAVKNLDAKVIIDKDVAGRFVITSVNDSLGEVYG